MIVFDVFAQCHLNKSLLLSGDLHLKENALLKFPKFGQVSAPVFWCSNKFHHSFELLHTWLGISRTCSTERTVEMGRQAVTRCCKRTRLHTFYQCGIISTQSSTANSSRFGLVFFHVQPLQLWRRMCFISFANSRLCLRSIRILLFDIQHSSQSRDLRKSRFHRTDCTLASLRFSFHAAPVMSQCITLMS